ncbi:N-acetylglucosamine-6-phosphate deacetylase [Kineococcus rubinsiae]|uniref:N-acetylglucosamine-6-phosphate deacetylase n=1 Tax=Kineococcus rubinsiae TaxID=2609562 RepID=UPI00143082CC|nr:N-acetylglucosamine-6-phosphate deacetylase [Kineococcus rubinsiae]NIZ91258.1 N-acetylglucosamine-6-phosphate deacetylase [Kineococcus rubinsiae]
MTTVLVEHGTVRTGRRVLTDGWVLLRDGVVTALGEGAAPAPDRAAAEVVDASGATVVPGFVDLHCHGGGGEQFGGTGEAAVRSARTVAATHRAHGTTTLVASLVSRPPAELRETVAALADLVGDGVLAGVHLEGPWLSPLHRGAHDPALLQPPAPADVEDLLRAGGGAVRVVTLAPELPGGLDAVRRVAGSGAVAAIGHTDADAELARAAVDAGARLATHLFNAMPPVHHRAPGPVVALLEDERVVVELIADGVHLHPLTVAHAAHSAGPRRTALVTDAMAAAGGADGDYLLGDLHVEVRGGTARLAPGGSIAGSTLTMDRALAFAVHEAGLDLDDALAAATSVPAGLLGRADRGHLEPGATGGAVLLDAELRVLRVLA